MIRTSLNMNAKPVHSLNNTELSALLQGSNLSHNGDQRTNDQA